MANTSLLKPTSVEVALSENNPNRAVITNRSNAATATRSAMRSAASF